MSLGVLAQIMGPDGLIILVVLVVVLLFGGSKLPKLARSLGSASHEFKSASEEFKKASDEGVAITVIHAPPAVPTVTPPAGDANGTESHPSPFS